MTAAAVEYEVVKEGVPIDHLVRANDLIEKIVNSGVPSWIGAGGYNYDSLVEFLGKRLAMSDAKLNDATQHKKELYDVSVGHAR